MKMIKKSLASVKFLIPFVINYANFLFFVICIFFGCDNKCDIEIDPVYDNLFYKYKSGDTLSFRNNTDHAISKIIIDSVNLFYNRGSFTSIASKGVNVRASYLQSNASTHSDIIFLLYDCIGEVYNIRLELGNFILAFENVEDYITSDSLLIDIGIEKYYSFENPLDDEQLETSSITKIIWTESYGLTRYYLNNGTYYEISKN